MFINPSESESLLIGQHCCHGWLSRRLLASSCFSFTTQGKEARFFVEPRSGYRKTIAAPQSSSLIENVATQRGEGTACRRQSPLASVSGLLLNESARMR